jgi:hypothetical protein
MRLISALELHQQSESELSALFRTVSKGLILTERGSPERKKCSRLARKHQPGTGGPDDSGLARGAKRGLHALQA